MLAEIMPSLRTSAKSRTRRNKRFAIRGVPRERRATSKAALSSNSRFKQEALLVTIEVKSSTE